MSPLLLILALLLVGVSLAVAAFALRHAAGEQRRQLSLLMLLRAGALALIALALVNPVWQRRIHRQTRPPLTLLLDASASVARHYGPAQAALASAPVRRQLARFDPVTLYFGEGLTPPPTGAPSEPATNLDLALRQTRARYPRSPILLFSDGAETAGEARVAAAQAAAAGSPVHTIGLGPTQPPPNLGSLVIQAPRVVREKQPVPLRVLVRSTGYSGPQPLQVELDGKPLAALSVSLAPGSVTTVKHQLPGLAAGYHLLTAKTPARPDEATTADNVRNQIIEARRDETRLILLAGAPDPDYAALQRLLGRLPKLRAQAYVRLGPGRYLHQEKDLTNRQAPDLPKLLRDAHVAVLMNYTAGSTESAQLRTFVQNGGAVGAVPGSAGFQPAAVTGTAGFQPAAVGSYTAAPTPVAAPSPHGPLGEELARSTSPTWWRNAPFLAGYTALSPRSGSEVILRAGGGQPLLVTGSFGAGATLIFGGSGTYRWLLSPEADEDSRRLYEAFWQTLIGWLSQPREHRRLVVMLDPPIAPEGRPVRLLAALGGTTDAKMRAEITEVRPALRPSSGPAGKPAVQTVPLAPSAAAPGRYLAAVSGLAPGKYTVRFVVQAAGATLRETRQLVVEPGGAELAVLTRQEGNLRAVAAAGHGRYAPIEQLAQLLARIPATPITSPMTRPAHPFRTALPLAMIVLLLSLEWWLRRRWGW